MIRISHLIYYPVKSMGGISLQEARVGSRGLKDDRRWMLTDSKGQFLSQREFPQLALFQPRLLNDQLVLIHSQRSESYVLDRGNPEQPFAVTVWKDDVGALLCSPDISNWCSEILSFEVKMVYMPDDAGRLADSQYAGEHQLTSFADDYPLLLIGQSSLDDLNTRLAEPVPMNRFRPNIVTEGADAFAEDEWDEFSSHQVSMKAVKPCARCVVTTIDQRTLHRSKEPLKTLATYRTRNKKLMFGQNVIPLNEGILMVGDEIRIH